jgi:lipoprotein-anchoring transpeptidase ErfK/SrfK
MAKGRHLPKRRFGAAVVVAVVAGSLLLTAGGISYAGYRYEEARADRILPGVTIAGVDVGGMTRAEAMRAVRSAAGQALDSELAVTVGDSQWIATRSDLGRRANVAKAVREALGVSDSMSTFDRFWHRFRDEPVERTIDLEYHTVGPGVADLVERITKDVFRAPQNAAIGLDDDGVDLTFTKAKDGEKLDADAATAAIRQALDADASTARLSMTRVAPKVTQSTMGRTIVVRLDQNTLYLYNGFNVIRSWPVATAKPGFTTPTGVWTIWDMRENPTWYNPALDSWGAGEPAVVPGGPGNPMGTRAIYIDAPGLIRVHGTNDPGSIGRYASHGCIRMHNEDVEQLFDMIDVGQHVIVVGHRPAGAAYWDTPPSKDA